jgi:hypothetical protein
MPEQPHNVSVVTPLAPSVDRVKLMLFNPFDLGTWLVLGFCVWLAQLGRVTGGGGTGFNFGGHKGVSPQSFFNETRDYILNNLTWIVPVASAILLIGLVIWLALTWVSSRGQFMLLHDVATGRAEIAAPWTQYGRHSDSLFVFRAVLGLIGFGLMLPLLVAIVWMLGRLFAPEAGAPLPIIGLILVGLTGILVAMLLAVVRKLTLDFVVPIMYLHTARCMEAWGTFWALLTHNLGHFLLYLIFSLLLAVALSLLILAAVLVTCCCLGCLLILPYVGTVVLLPISIFKRAYSLEYLAQFGPEFNVFAR